LLCPLQDGRAEVIHRRDRGLLGCPGDRGCFWRSTADAHATSRRSVMAKAIGIDLGTTNSCVAVMEGSQPKVIEKRVLGQHR